MVDHPYLLRSGLKNNCSATFDNAGLLFRGVDKIAHESPLTALRHRTSFMKMNQKSESKPDYFAFLKHVP
jgi:hypothetical protein